MENTQVKQIFESAQRNIELDYQEFNEMLGLYKDSEPKFIELVQLILNWKCHEKKSFWLYKMFRKSFNTSSDVLFLNSLRSFAINCFLDDSNYKLVWTKTDYKDTVDPENTDLILCAKSQYDRSGDLKTIVVDESDEKSRPEVSYYGGDDGSQKIEPVLHAMQIMEQREIAHDKELNKMIELLQNKVNYEYL